MTDLEDWLSQHDLSAIGPTLTAQDIDLSTLPMLDEEDFKELGLSLGHRRRLRTAIDAISAGETSPTPQKSDALPAERRNVAVLFVDLSGFTALSRALDPEALGAVVDDFMALVRDKVESFGGLLDKQVGDGALAVFGAPRAYGDDALRAARAALAILEAMPALRSPVDRPLSAHAGIAMGEVVSGGDHGTIGDAVNLAARLDALAADGQVLIDQALHEELGTSVETFDLGERDVKGFERPIRIRRLERITADAPSDPATPLIGRTVELSQVLVAGAAARDQGAGSVVVLRGEPGIGKTRLVEELERRFAEEGHGVHRGLFLNFGSEAARDAVRVVMRGLLGLAEDAAATERTKAASVLASDTGDKPRLRVAIGDLLDAPADPVLKAVENAVDAEAKAEDLRDGLDILLRRSCAERSRLILFEDVHWAPDAAIPLLAHLARSVRHERCVLVMTTRAEGGPLARSGALSDMRATVIDLAPLRARDAETLARTRLANAPDLASACVKRAEGNPLFLEQLIRAAAGGSKALPATLQQVVLSRIDELGPRDRAAIRAASVFGQRFRLDDLRRLINDPGFSCASLQERGLLKRDGEDYLFGHALLQEGVYSSILKSERRNLHEAAAALFENRDAPLRARHLRHARSTDAGTAHLAAAHEAFARHRLDVALDLVHEASDLPMDNSIRLKLRMLEARILSDQGRSQDAATAWEQALDLAESPTDRGRGLLGLAGARRLSGDFDAAGAAADASLTLLEVHGDPVDRAWAMHLKGNLYFAAGQAAACETSHTRALELARDAGDAEAETAALGGLADAAIAQGRMRSAHSALMRCIEAARGADLARTEAGYLSISPLTSFFALDFAGADARASEAFAAARRIGHLRAEYMVHNSIEYALFQRADKSGCRASLEQANALLNRLGNRAFHAYALEKAANIHVLEGNIAAARAKLDAALIVARETNFRLSGPRLLAYRAKLADDKAEARRFAAEARAALDEGALGLNTLLATAHEADTALIWGDDTWALEAATALEALAETDAIAWALRVARRTKVLAGFCAGSPSPKELAEAQVLREAAASDNWKIEHSILNAAISRGEAAEPWTMGRLVDLMHIA